MIIVVFESSPKNEVCDLISLITCDTATILTTITVVRRIGNGNWRQRVLESNHTSSQEYLDVDEPCHLNCLHSGPPIVNSRTEKVCLNAPNTYKFRLSDVLNDIHDQYGASFD